MKSRRARARVLLLWLASCGGGAGPSDPVPPSCVLPPDGAGFLLMVADGNADPAVSDLELFAVRTDGTCRQLVASGPGDDLDPSWSGTAGRVAWGGLRGGNARVVLQDVAGGAQLVLDTGPELASAPSLSPDGALVAFERLADGAATTDVYVVAASGGTPVEVAAGLIEVRNQQGDLLGTCPANDAGPVFSDTDQGRFVYFISSRAANSCAASGQANEVWRQAVGAAGAPVGPPERVTTGSQILGRPAVSPDGRSLAYARPAATTRSMVVLHDLLTHEERTVTDRGDTEPSFSPAGDVLAVRTLHYDTAGRGLGDIMLVDVATGDILRRLTDGEVAVWTPTFPH